MISVSDPLAPRVVAEYTDLVDNQAFDLDIVGMTLVITNERSVDLLDISDPTHPRRAGRFEVAPGTGTFTSLATNPIADEPPTNEMLRFFTNLDESLMERLQREFQDARLVKAFSSVGNSCMVNPQFKGGRPTMFICGNDEEAKKMVRAILDQFGWETADMGMVEAARAIEPLCMLCATNGFTLLSC